MTSGNGVRSCSRSGALAALRRRPATPFAAFFIAVPIAEAPPFSADAA